MPLVKPSNKIQPPHSPPFTPPRELTVPCKSILRSATVQAARERAAATALSGLPAPRELKGDDAISHDADETGTDEEDGLLEYLGPSSPTDAYTGDPEARDGLDSAGTGWRRAAVDRTAAAERSLVHAAVGQVISPVSAPTATPQRRSTVAIGSDTRPSETVTLPAVATSVPALFPGCDPARMRQLFGPHPDPIRSLCDLLSCRGTPFVCPRNL